MIFRRFRIYRSFIRSFGCVVVGSRRFLVFIISVCRVSRVVRVVRVLSVLIGFLRIVRIFVRYIDIGYIDIVISVGIIAVRQTDIVFLVTGQTFVAGFVRIAAAVKFALLFAAVAAAVSVTATEHENKHCENRTNLKNSSHHSLLSSGAHPLGSLKSLRSLVSRASFLY